MHMFCGLELACGGKIALAAAPARHLLPIGPAASLLPVGGGMARRGAGARAGDGAGWAGLQRRFASRVNGSTSLRAPRRGA